MKRATARKDKSSQPTYLADLVADEWAQAEIVSMFDGGSEGLDPERKDWERTRNELRGLLLLTEAMIAVDEKAARKDPTQ